MKNDAQVLRKARNWHRTVASILFFFFFVISATAVLLGWKSLFEGKMYSSEVKQKTSKSLNDWLPLDSLRQLAINGLKQKAPSGAEGKPVSLNAVLDKGYARFTFNNHYNVQLNAQTGAIQSIDKKAPDWILKLHDGEIVDEWLSVKNGNSKRIYSTVLGLGLFFLTLSGFWMWFKPLVAKRANKKIARQSIPSIY